LSSRLASNLSASGLDPKLVTQLLDPLPGTELVIDAGVRLAMADSIHLVFVIAFVSAALGLVAVLFTPHQELKEKSPEGQPPMISMD
jgi:hypothetical protein